MRVNLTRTSSPRTYSYQIGNENDTPVCCCRQNRLTWGFLGGRDHRPFSSFLAARSRIRGVKRSVTGAFVSLATHLQHGPTRQSSPFMYMGTPLPTSHLMHLMSIVPRGTSVLNDCICASYHTSAPVKHPLSEPRADNCSTWNIGARERRVVGVRLQVFGE